MLALGAAMLLTLAACGNNTATGVTPQAEPVQTQAPAQTAAPAQETKTAPVQEPEKGEVISAGQKQMNQLDNTASAEVNTEGLPSPRCS